MMVSVGLAGGVVAVSAITSSPTLVILSGVRESRLSPSELELSLDSRLFPRLRGVIKSDSRSFGATVGLWGGGGVAARFYLLSPQRDLLAPRFFPGGGGEVLLVFLHSLAEGGLLGKVAPPRGRACRPNNHRNAHTLMSGEHKKLTH